jgi:hypothetical protein
MVLRRVHRPWSPVDPIPEVVYKRGRFRLGTSIVSRIRYQSDESRSTEKSRAVRVHREFPQLTLVWLLVGRRAGGLTP